MAGKSKGGGRLSRSQRAGTVFPVGRLARNIRLISPHLRLGSAAPVYLAAVIEYLTAEILELAGNHARDNRKKRIRPRDIRLGVGLDTELSKLCQDVTFSDGGSMVNIRGELIPGHPQYIGKHPKFQSTVSAVRKKATKRPAVKVITVPKKKAKPTPARVPMSHATSAGPTIAPSTSLPVLSEGMLFLGQKLLVVMGDIALVTSDAIVHPTNATYSTSGQVGQVLLRAGGLQYQTALNLLKAEGNLALCGVSMCDMFNIDASKIIHCYSPSWNMSKGVEDLHKTIENCLKLADREHLKSIALPSVGSGNAGWPKQLAAETILRTINRYFQTIMASSIKQVYFVLYDKESVDIYTSELKKLLENSDY